MHGGGEAPGTARLVVAHVARVHRFFAQSTSALTANTIARIRVNVRAAATATAADGRRVALVGVGGARTQRLVRARRRHRVRQRVAQRVRALERVY